MYRDRNQSVVRTYYTRLRFRCRPVHCDQTIPRSACHSAHFVIKIISHHIILLFISFLPLPRAALTPLSRSTNLLVPARYYIVHRTSSYPFACISFYCFVKNHVGSSRPLRGTSKSDHPCDTLVESRPRQYGRNNNNTHVNLYGRFLTATTESHGSLIPSSCVTIKRTIPTRTRVLCIIRVPTTIRRIVHSIHDGTRSKTKQK